ncbi:hypothetical protein [Flavobacterium cerinum]|uniref:SMODS-associating 2TM beta-strand rich effector domain-containing protein n=1 Tax=Flavobacterium cerinum TaxID=2502784 RepID=A0ABY5IWZ1_9FLAO|nr:hypothetical protein [Flavobacterium cerinum]UUC45981.1 hypothetical protein NOX80_01970 [Flavobacterium cerinum]
MEYKVLRKTNKKHITFNTLFYGGILVWVLTLFSSAIFDYIDIIWIKLLVLAELFFVMAIPLISFFKFNEYKTLKGELSSLLIFHPDGIQIDSKFHELDTIKKINLEHTSDYKGRFAPERGDFDGNLSNGVANLLVLNLINGTRISLHFQQSKQDEIFQEKENLIRYCNDGKLGLLSLLDILRITDYNEIQRFKKENISRLSN